jgi:hypothetical protein
MVPVTTPNPVVTPPPGPTTMWFVSEKPVAETPGGLTPKFPVIRLAPVLVTVVAPSTAKLCAEASGGADCALLKLPILNTQIPNKSFFIIKLAFSVMSLTVREGSVESDPGTRREQMLTIMPTSICPLRDTLERNWPPALPVPVLSVSLCRTGGGAITVPITVSQIVAEDIPLCVAKWYGSKTSVSAAGLVRNAHGSSTLRECLPVTRSLK